MIISELAEELIKVNGATLDAAKKKLQRACEKGEIPGAVMIKSRGKTGKTWDVPLDQAGKIIELEKLKLAPPQEQQQQQTISSAAVTSERASSPDRKTPEQIEKELYDRSISKQESERLLKAEQVIAIRRENLIEDGSLIYVDRARNSYRRGMDIFFGGVREFVDALGVKEGWSAQKQAEIRAQLEKTLKKSLEKIKNELGNRGSATSI